MAKAAHAGAYEQLPLLGEDGPAAVATLRDPTDGLLSGFSPRTPFFGSAAAVLHYNCFS